MKLELALAVLILCLALFFAYFSTGAPDFFAAATPKEITLPSHATTVQSSITELQMQKIPLYAGGSSGFSTYITGAKIDMGACAPFDAESYDAGNTASTPLPAGKLSALVGYFASVKQDCEITLSGDSAANLAGMRLIAGWNHIGAPSQPITAAAGLAGCKIESFKLFDSKQHAYVDADTFFPGNAYWVKVASDCTVSG